MKLKLEQNNQLISNKAKEEFCKVKKSVIKSPWFWTLLILSITFLILSILATIQSQGRWNIYVNAINAFNEALQKAKLEHKDTFSVNLEVFHQNIPLYYYTNNSHVTTGDTITVFGEVYHKSNVFYTHDFHDKLPLDYGEIWTLLTTPLMPRNNLIDTSVTYSANPEKFAIEAEKLGSYRSLLLFSPNPIPVIEHGHIETENYSFLHSVFEKFHNNMNYGYYIATNVFWLAFIVTTMPLIWFIVKILKNKPSKKKAKKALKDNSANV